MIKTTRLSLVKVARSLKLVSILISMMLLMLAVIALLPSVPILLRTPDIDSSVFLHMGSQILRGSVPYRDVWDHKPPLVFFINALGLWIKGNGRWGVWALEVAAVGAACLLLYQFMQRFFGRFPALFATVAFLGNLFFVNENGNLPEEYGLPLQAGILVLVADALSRKRANAHFLAIGILLGLAVSLKQTLLGIGVITIFCTLVFAIWLRHWRGMLGLLWIGAGFLIVWAVFGLYFWSQNALLDFFDQSIRYNFFYSGVTNTDRIHALRAILTNLYTFSGFFSMGLLVWLIILPFLFLNDEHLRKAVTSRWIGVVVLLVGLAFLFNGLWDDNTGRLYAITSLSSYRRLMIGTGFILAVASMPFFTGWVMRKAQSLSARLPSAGCPGMLLPLGIAFVDLPLELALSSLSGRPYYHYYVSLLPSLSVLIAFLAWAILSAQVSSVNRLSRWIWLAVLSLPVIVTGWYVTIAAIHRTESLNVQEAVNFIQQNSQPDEAILQWGTNVRLHFLTGRPAASRYTYQQPLFTPGYVTPGKIQEFLSALQENPPVLIVDTRPDKMPLIYMETNCADIIGENYFLQVIRKDRDARYPLAKNDPLPFVPLEMKNVYRWICENYEMVSTPGRAEDAWRYYLLRPVLP